MGTKSTIFRVQSAFSQKPESSRIFKLSNSS
jgi:hypothetical protein